jgi:hypothetical protein
MKTFSTRSFSIVLVYSNFTVKGSMLPTPRQKLKRHAKSA